MYSVQKAQDRALEWFLEKAKIQGGHPTESGKPRVAHPDFKMKYPQEARAISQKQMTETTKRIKQQFTDLKNELQRRKEKLGERTS